MHKAKTFLPPCLSSANITVNQILQLYQQNKLCSPLLNSKELILVIQGHRGLLS